MRVCQTLERRPTCRGIASPVMVSPTRALPRLCQACAEFGLSWTALRKHSSASARLCWAISTRPSSLTVVPGTEAAQAAYPYYMQFDQGDDERFWFYNSMHFPEPMSAFDMVTAEAAYCALGAVNTRVHCLPTTLGIDYRIINGRVYIGGNGVTARRPRARIRATSSGYSNGFGR